MSRVKAIYRSWDIPCAGKQIYAPRHRAEWLAKITEVGVLRRAEFYYQQLDALRVLRQAVRHELLAESKKHKVSKLFCQIPSIGPIRAALLIALIQTPHRFRTKRPFWKYSGFAIEMHSSADYRNVKGQLERTRKQISVRGLNRDCNHDLKNLFKSAATIPSVKPGQRSDENRWANVSSNRAYGAEVQNRSCSIMWAAKQEKVRPVHECFFLLSFI
jgi:transposase